MNSSRRFWPLRLWVNLTIVGSAMVSGECWAGGHSPSITVTKSLRQITIAPVAGAVPTGCVPSATVVDLRVVPAGFKGRKVASKIVVTAGRMGVARKKFAWDLSGVGPGNYVAMVDSKTNKGEAARMVTSIEVVECR